ncbi:MAG: heavy-metal-associated domain-containing protein [Planctomycetes bacterium]|nr:heavy-metal-associated domain-containing protein [Planctomycetota bacterium]
MPTAKLEISGMSCDHCVSQIRECLLSRSGVQAAEVVIGRASIEFDEQACSVADLVAAIHDLGRFQVASFSVRGSDA